MIITLKIKLNVISLFDVKKKKKKKNGKPALLNFQT